MLENTKRLLIFSSLRKKSEVGVFPGVEMIDLLLGVFYQESYW